MDVRCAGWVLLMLFGSGSTAAYAAKAAEPESISIRFDSLSPTQGATLSLDVVGDGDGETTLANVSCCGIEDAKRYVRDVRVRAGMHVLPVVSGAKGWTVRHAPRATLTVSYRLPPSGPSRIDGGTAEQMRPLIDGGRFHLIGTTSLLLPTGRGDGDSVVLDIDAQPVAREGEFVSSFGTGTALTGVRTTRAQARSALYVAGDIALTLHDTPSGRVGIVYSGLAPEAVTAELTKDALEIIAIERAFFDDAQPWYLVSVHGGPPANPDIKLGGGTGLTHSFAMFVNADFDAANAEQREQFRWVFAHEYLHQWLGLTLRVASRPHSDHDDTSVYWFSEGVTDFYAMRLLTRAGLQTSERSRDVLDDRLRRYARNSKRTASATEAGALFWTDAEGAQLPYLRGYLAAWLAERSPRLPQSDDLDARIRALVDRARKQPQFRVDNVFLASYLAVGLTPATQSALQRFIVEGGDFPLAPDSLAPCLTGAIESIAGKPTLQFDFADARDTACFRH